MDIKKRRCGKIPRNVKRISEKETYFIEDIFSCSLYQISEMKLCSTRVKPFKFANAFTTNKIWQGGLYYTKGDRIDMADNKTLTECIVVIKESSNNYRRIDGQEFYIGYVPNSSKTSIYLFKNGNLYLMEKDYYPDMPQDSYRLLEEICNIPSHIEVFNETIKPENNQPKKTCLDFVVEKDIGYFCRYDDLIGPTTEESSTNTQEQAGPVLTKKLTSPRNQGNK